MEPCCYGTEYISAFPATLTPSTTTTMVDYTVSFQVLLLALQACIGVFRLGRLGAKMALLLFLKKKQNTFTV